jgi:hypothetical protein
VILALVYLRAIPLAVRSLAANDAPALGTKKTVAKAGFLFVVYIALFVFAGVQGLRASHKR